MPDRYNRLTRKEREALALANLDRARDGMYDVAFAVRGARTAGLSFARIAETLGMPESRVRELALWDAP